MVSVGGSKLCCAALDKSLEYLYSIGSVETLVDIYVKGNDLGVAILEVNCPIFIVRLGFKMRAV